MPLLATNAAAATSFHNVADAADRLRGQPTLEAHVTLAPPTDRAQAERIQRGQRSEEVRELVKAVRRDIERR